MAPSRRVARQPARGTPSIRGGIRRSRRERRTAIRLMEPDTIHVQQQRDTTSGSALAEPVSPSSSTLSSGTLDNDSESAAAPPSVPIDLQTLTTILQQREDQLLDRILTHFPQPHNASQALPPPVDTTTGHYPSHNQPSHLGSELGARLGDSRGMFSPPPAHHDESASATMDTVEMLFPGVERSTLTQIIENRFKPTNIYRLLASEKDRAESQRVISIGGVSFEQGEREGRESEHRMGPFFKAWAAYCGILTKLAPFGLQGDLACSLSIYTMNLHDLLERYAWEGVKAYHFQFHRKRIASGKEVYYPDDWRRIDAELIASKCFLYPSPSISRNWSSARGHSFGRGQQPPQNSPNQYPANTVTGTPNPLPGPPAVLDAQSTRAVVTQPAMSCRNWNYRECRSQQFRYLHLCISCGGSHRIGQCAANTSGRGGVPSR